MSLALSIAWHTHAQISKYAIPNIIDMDIYNRRGIDPAIPGDKWCSRVTCMA
jgi:hypothetical protein